MQRLRTVGPRRVLFIEREFAHSKEAREERKQKSVFLKKGSARRLLWTHFVGFTGSFTGATGSVDESARRVLQSLAAVSVLPE